MWFGSDNRNESIQIIDPCMIFNMFVYLVCLYLFRFSIHVFFLLTKNTHRVLYFYFVWSVLSKKFFSFYVFVCNLFFRFCFVFRLFSGQPKVFGSIYGWTKDLESTPSGQDWVKRLRSCLAGNVCVKGVFWFKGVYSKHSLMPVLTVLFQGKMSFCQIKPI